MSVKRRLRTTGKRVHLKSLAIKNKTIVFSRDDKEKLLLNTQISRIKKPTFVGFC